MAKPPDVAPAPWDTATALLRETPSFVQALVAGQDLPSPEWVNQIVRVHRELTRARKSSK